MEARLHQNNLIPSDAVVVTAGSAAVNFCGLLVLTAGDVTVTTAAFNSVTFSSVPAGTTIALGITKVTACPANTVGFIP